MYYWRKHLTQKLRSAYLHYVYLLTQHEIYLFSLVSREEYTSCLRNVTAYKLDQSSFDEL